MPLRTVINVPVSFPYDPYTMQLSMMTRIIAALNNKQNCLLESPTGTGKTMALLCASLAWIKNEGEKSNKNYNKVKFLNHRSTPVTHRFNTEGISNNEAKTRSERSGYKSDPKQKPFNNKQQRTNLASKLFNPSNTLIRTLNGYMPPHLRLEDECSRNIYLEKSRRNFKCVLNKIAPQNFDLCFTEIISLITKTDWKDVLVGDYMDCLIEEIFDKIFSWTHLTPLNNVKVVILGQDPYHGKGEAHGLAFSVLEPCKPPRSLVNIYKELETDIEGFKKPGHGNLTRWAEQGVLLLNAVLTVREASANSHKDKGWETLTDAVIELLNKKENLVFILWGKYAQKKCVHINRNKHKIIQCGHPSSLSAKHFLGQQCFSKTNEFLESKNIKLINWADL